MTENAEKHSDSKLTLEHPVPWICLGTISGNFSAQDMLPAYVKAMTAALDQGRPMHSFHDWEMMTGYDSKCRQDMTTWSLRHKGRIEKHHVLLRSKIVAMGVATANLLLGGDMVVSYTSRKVFEVALRTASR